MGPEVCEFPICVCSSWLRVVLNIKRDMVSSEIQLFRYSSTLPCTDSVSGNRVHNEFWDEIKQNN